MSATGSTELRIEKNSENEFTLLGLHANRSDSYSAAWLTVGAASLHIAQREDHVEITVYRSGEEDKEAYNIIAIDNQDN